MLVLTRKLGESIVADCGITFKILGIKGKKVTVGVKAPDSVVIDREEVAMDKILRQGLEPYTSPE